MDGGYKLKLVTFQLKEKENQDNNLIVTSSVCQLAA